MHNVLKALLLTINGVKNTHFDKALYIKDLKKSTATYHVGFLGLVYFL